MSVEGRHISDFELVEVNLIPDTPIEYAFNFVHNKRLVQKATKEELIASVQENWKKIAYVKMGKDALLLPISEIPELEKPIIEQKIATLKSERYSGPLTLLFWYALTVWVWRDYSTLGNVILVCSLIFVAAYVFIFFSNRKRMRRLEEELDRL